MRRHFTQFLRIAGTVLLTATASVRVAGAQHVSRARIGDRGGVETAAPRRALERSDACRRHIRREAVTQGIIGTAASVLVLTLVGVKWTDGSRENVRLAGFAVSVGLTSAYFATFEARRHDVCRIQRDTSAVHGQLFHPLRLPGDASNSSRIGARSLEQLVGRAAEQRTAPPRSRGRAAAEAKEREIS